MKRGMILGIFIFTTIFGADTENTSKTTLEAIAEDGQANKNMKKGPASGSHLERMIIETPAGRRYLSYSPTWRIKVGGPDYDGKKENEKGDASLEG
jgi:hypothetical protein